MSKDRRTHSSIEKLPADLRAALTAMIVDNVWPVDFPANYAYDGDPRYEDLVFYCNIKGCSVSASAIGRFGMRMRTLARMKQAGVIVRDVMANLTAENASQTQKAVAEMITAQTIEFVAGENMSAKDIMSVARAMKDCTAISIAADKYVHEQIEKKAEAAAKSTKKKLKKAGVDRKVIQEIIDEQLGITKS